MAVTTKARALESVSTMMAALDEAEALQNRMRQADAAGRTLEAELLQAQAAKLSERLISLSAEIDRTRREFLEDVHDVAAATLAVMTRVAEMEGAPHGHHS